MKRNVEAFIKELASYINSYIAGKENTHIRQCRAMDTVRNRGHMIAMDLIVPEDVRGSFTDQSGPVFYAEELLNEFPNNTVAHIGEVLNVRVNEFYDGFIAMMREQLKAMDKTIDDYDLSDIVLTAIPTSQCGDDDSEPFISRKDPRLGLTLILKGVLCDAQGENQCYFTPIRKKEGHEGTRDHWEAAAKNSLSHTNIQIKMGMIPASKSDIPAIGMIMDACNFYDFFYLLSPEYVWKGLKKEFNADRVYIIPNGAYSAVFILDSQEIRKDPLAKAMRDSLLKKGINDLKDKPLPVFVLDCDTLKITRYKEG